MNPEEFEQHLTEMRTVNARYDPPLIDFWAPDTIEGLTDLEKKKGLITGTIGRYRIQYYEGRYLPVELNILDAETGRRIAQDGSEERWVLERLRERLEASG